MAEPTSSPSPSSPAAVVGQARALWGKLPGRARLAAVAVVVVVLGAIGYLALASDGPTWQPVAQQLSPEDVNELSNVLSSHAIPNRLGAGGKTIEVPPDKLAEARVAAAAAGLPRGGVGFELFEGASLGQSSFA